MIYEKSCWGQAFLVLLLCATLSVVTACQESEVSNTVFVSQDSIVVRSDNMEFFVDPEGFRYGFREVGGTILVSPHSVSGLVAGVPDSLMPAQSTEFVGEKEGAHAFEVTLQDGTMLSVLLRLSDKQARFHIESSAEAPMAMALRTAGADPGYGLGDNLVAWLYKNGGDPLFTTNITGFVDDDYRAFGNIRRASSNFAIYPKHRFALINIDPTTKMVRSTSEEILQGSRSTMSIDNFYYFFGSTQEIYKTFLDVRNVIGYPVMEPKYPFFGVGWEAYGALGWQTRQETVMENVNTYLDMGYPLSWMVVGSGFWPHSESRLAATTSFGMWDSTLYPDPEALKSHFRGKGLAFLMGLRISFITDGPFSEEGVEKGYFLQENGAAKVYDILFPDSPSYLLDAHNEDAVQWYVDLADRWGADGFKEDLYGFEDYVLRDDKLNRINEVLMERGYHIMQRNTYLASAGELHRINDFNYEENQDRGPINTLASAYAGLPMTYMDIVGGLFGGLDLGDEVSPRIKAYMMRNARIAALHPSMSLGKGPWHFNDDQVSDVMLESAKLHGRLHPYFYSQARRFHADGFPWPMVPLSLIFPEDEQVHYYHNSSDRMYQWMIGDALLAYPLYGDDYEMANTRDVYLPEGLWIDYDTGERFLGPQRIKDFEIPVEKTPLFVGGTGIVIEKVEDRIMARVYPVATEAQTVYYSEGGASPARIVVESPDWTQVTVWDTTEDQEVIYHVVRHAIEFELRTDHDYTIR